MHVNRGSGGITLMEIMVGVFIMAIILFPSLMVIMNESKAITGTRDHSQAAFIGHTLIETARAYTFENLEAFPTEFQNRTYTFNGIEYSIKDLALAKITPSGDSSQTSAFRMNFSVRYTSREGRNMSLDLATVIGRHE